MDAILIWVVIAIIVYALKNSKKRVEEQERKQAQKQVDAQVNQTFQKSQSASPAGLKSVHTMVSSSYNGRGGKAPGQNLQQKAPANAREAVKAAKTTAAPGGHNDKSTTEMLAEKARIDQIDHQREKAEHYQHEKKYYGNYHYAERYLLGDEVPPTKKLVYCPNCAAENLIKLYENPHKYNCYFCREQLG